jgi:hypothetical protein
MDEDAPFSAEQIDEFTIGDNEPLPFPYVRESRLTFPRGPLNKTWIRDQIYAGNIRSAVLIPRDRFHGTRVIHLQSVLDLIEKLAQAAGEPNPPKPRKRSSK